MKKFVIVIILLVFLFGCHKEEIKIECELNNTFQLHYKNYYQYSPVILSIHQDSTYKCDYIVQPKELIVVDVKTNYSGIYIIQNQDTLDKFFNIRPNPCANINYYF